jgi:hypothetical protein
VRGLRLKFLLLFKFLKMVLDKISAAIRPLIPLAAAGMLTQSGGCINFTDEAVLNDEIADLNEKCQELLDNGDVSLSENRIVRELFSSWKGWVFEDGTGSLLRRDKCVCGWELDNGQLINVVCQTRLNRSYANKIVWKSSEENPNGTLEVWEPSGCRGAENIVEDLDQNSEEARRAKEALFGLKARMIAEGVMVKD